MRKIFGFVLTLLISLSALVALPASASSSLTAGETVVGWDPTRFFEPDGCTRYDVNYVQPSSVLVAVVEVRNRYGDSLAKDYFLGAVGTRQLQICSLHFDSSEGPFRLVVASTSGNGNSYTEEVPLNFLARGEKVVTPVPTAALKPVKISSDLTAGETVVGWDPSRFFEPDGCTVYDIYIVQSSRVLAAVVEVRNRYGDSLATNYFLGTRGTRQLQICSLHFDSSEGPFRLVVASTSGNGNSYTEEATLNFLARDLPSPPKPNMPPEPKLIANQRTLASFSETSTTLTSMQKSQVKAAVEANLNATKFICTGIRYVSQPMSENIKVRKRAKAACDYAKTLNPELSTWYQNKPTEARSYAGKVLLTIKSPAN
jgi:hypothetical protein